MYQSLPFRCLKFQATRPKCSRKRRLEVLHTADLVYNKSWIASEMAVDFETVAVTGVDVDGSAVVGDTVAQQCGATAKPSPDHLGCSMCSKLSLGGAFGEHFRCPVGHLPPGGGIQPHFALRRRIPAPNAPRRT
jgi:hypothetical protein